MHLIYELIRDCDDKFVHDCVGMQGQGLESIWMVDNVNNATKKKILEMKKLEGKDIFYKKMYCRFFKSPALVSNCFIITTSQL